MDMNSLSEERAYVESMINKYEPEVNRLVPYLPWLEENLGENMFSTFDSDGLSKTSVAFPVYDSNLLSLVNLINSMDLINPNYVYVYSRNRIRDEKDERAYIQSCDKLADLEGLAGILSKYVLKGMTRGIVWSQGVQNGAFYHTITQMQQIIKKYK